MIEQKHCPICGSGQLNKLMEVPDFRNKRESFQLQRCISCGFVLTSPRPQDENLGEYYPKEDYSSHNEAPKGLFDKVYFEVQKRNLAFKKNHITGLCSVPGKLLDYGCGAGSFAAFMKDFGWDCEGVEPSAAAAEIAGKRLGKKVMAPNEFEPKANLYDIITLWHVLEHIPDFETVLAKLSQALKPGGYLLLALPNHKSLDAEYYGRYWAAWDVPLHLWHFGPEHINALATKFGLEWQKPFPLPFDAYYVSMLSEQYKRNVFWPFAGFWRGWLSNTAAKRSNLASSLTYVLKRPEKSR